ncbi:MAG: hypothetical protein MRERV_2c052 [Mycoplasmataceae bacterium RV_VA103A]|nr:MAG: hypothetical protein MRERV_2c052 [Mycoplasmataceae bacterium RV_VA103A]
MSLVLIIACFYFLRLEQNRKIILHKVIDYFIAVGLKCEAFF